MQGGTHAGNSLASATVESDLLSFFQDVFACSADTALCIGRKAYERRYPAAAVIISQGDQTDSTYLVAEGRAHAYVHSRDGQRVLVQEFARGDFFGAVAEFDREPAESEVAAVEDLRAAVFRFLDFLGLLEVHSCVARALARMLAKQLKTASTKMVERTILSAAGRVHAELLRLAKLSENGRTIRPAPVLANLAVHVQSTRETVSRAINALERRGIIRRENDALIIVAPHRLEELII